MKNFFDLTWTQVQNGENNGTNIFPIFQIIIFLILGLFHHISYEPCNLWTCVLNPLASFWYYFSLETSAGNGLFQIAIDCFQTKLSSNVGFRANIIKTRSPGFNKVDSKTNFCILFILFSGEIGHSNPGYMQLEKWSWISPNTLSNYVYFGFELGWPISPKII